jgi:hydrogenase nickel incorporation protein HypB
MFRSADMMLLSKADLLPVLDDFRPENARRHLQELANPAPVIELSAKTGAGLDLWLQWLRDAIARHRSVTPQEAQDAAAATAT